ncbi:MAG: LysM peptidoglycan-binding domain-containing protein [Phycisphaeraceae bacterium]|nr:LysM peptidoglycan-binding domain-containing protein [Phycisphaeraceae bacterium]
MFRPELVAKSVGIAAAVWIVIYWWWLPGGDRDLAPLTSGSAEHALPRPPRAELAPPPPALTEPTPPTRAATAERTVDATGSTAITRPTREYVVRSGDTIERIARRELGSVTRQREILELNPGIDPLRLQIRAVLLLPLE